jgi:CBS domain containing-hemolysin-like protein
MSVHSLLDYFIKKRKHLFMVTDEFGQIAGVVTLEDAIETLLGREIIDETDTVVDMQALARSKYRQKLRAGKNNSS